MRWSREHSNKVEMENRKVHAMLVEWRMENAVEWRTENRKCCRTKDDMNFVT